jgi:hypothetical protein
MSPVLRGLDVKKTQSDAQRTQENRNLSVKYFSGSKNSKYAAYGLFFAIKRQDAASPFFEKKCLTERGYGVYTLNVMRRAKKRLDKDYAIL